MRSLISIEAADTFLRCVCGLCVTQVYFSNDGTFIVGLGPLYTLSHMVLRDAGVVEDRVVVSQYQISAAEGVILTDTSGFCKTIVNNDIDQIKLAKDLLVGKLVRNVQINSQKELCLTLGCGEDCLFLSAQDWSVVQPGTEEDSLMVTAETIIKETRLHRRWSYSFSVERDKWHTLPLEQKPERLTSAKRGLEFLQTFIGMQVLYAKKSPDMNLYDIGFSMIHDRGGDLIYPDSELHAVCKLIIIEQNGKKSIYYGDSEKEQFETTFSKFYTKEICEISLLAGNVLRIGFHSGTIEVIPADDGEESWRFFENKSQGKHLVAGNTWLWLQE